MQVFDDIPVRLELLAANPLSLTETERQQQVILKKVQDFCDSFEAKIAKLGGVGFFLGGIGPDGHVAFNQEGQPLNSRTRLVSFNYPTAAAAASDLGGIERARGKAAMTIGLSTILSGTASSSTLTSSSKDTRIIIMAAGEGKASVIQQAIEDEISPLRQASILQQQPAAVRCYLTHGAAMKLTMRRQEKISSISKEVVVPWVLQYLAQTYPTAATGAASAAYLINPPPDYALLESFLYETSLTKQIALVDLQLATHFPATATSNGHGNSHGDSSKGLSLPAWLQSEPLSFNLVITCAIRRLKDKIEGGLIESQPHAVVVQDGLPADAATSAAASSSTASTVTSASSGGEGFRILHTAPHHDDIMLSYHGAMHEMLGRQPIVQMNRLTQVRDEKKQVQVQLTQQMQLTQHSSSNGQLVQQSGGQQPPQKKARSESFGSILTHPQPSQMQPHSHLGYHRLGERYNGNLNHFAYLTSGFHSVNDDFLASKVQQVLAAWPHELLDNKPHQADKAATSVSFIEGAIKTGQLHRDYDEIMMSFHQAFLQEEQEEYIENIIFLRKVCEVFGIPLQQAYGGLVKALQERVIWIQEEYVQKHQPGDAVPKDMQLLKGCMRESEVDRVWALSRMPMNRIHHLRSKFYTDDFFTPMPSLEDDALPVANLIKLRQPDIFTVAFDPEGTGPDTHYKVLTVVAAGLRMALSSLPAACASSMVIWGYRNVWFRFSAAQATLFIPVQQADLDLMHDTFMSCFTTQKKASFPSPHYDGPFSAWARSIQIDQRQLLEVLLGKEYFTHHVHPKVRESAGFIFIQAMPVAHFLTEVEGLKSKFENV